VTELADIALGAFRSRQARAVRRKAAGEMTADEAEADVRPWAAMACRLGADLSELQAELSFLIAQGETPAMARVQLADDLCTRRQLVEALGPARDAAIDRAERTRKPEHIDAARQLMRLAAHFAWDINGKFFIRPYAWPADLAYPPAPPEPVEGASPPEGCRHDAATSGGIGAADHRTAA
jgi:hypothetical protein